MIKTIIVDLSEVVIAGLCGVEQALAPRLGKAPKEILAALGGELLVQLCRGELSEHAYLNSVLANSGWNISLDELKQVIRANFSHKVAGMESLLEHLATQYELVLLSDHAREWVEHIRERHAQLAVFKTQIYSFQIGQTKREPSTFLRVLEIIKRNPDECVFIDDSLVNIESARSVGIQSFHFTDARTLRDDLQRASLLRMRENSAA